MREIRLTYDFHDFLESRGKTEEQAKHQNFKQRDFTETNVTKCCLEKLIRLSI